MQNICLHYILIDTNTLTDSDFLYFSLSHNYVSNILITNHNVRLPESCSQGSPYCQLLTNKMCSALP